MRKRNLSAVATVILAAITAAWAVEPPTRIHEPRSLEALARSADLVCRGTITSAEAAWDDDHRLIYTHYTLDVLEVWAGDVPKTLRFTETGGEVGGVGLHVPGVPRYHVGEEVVFFGHHEKGRLMTLWFSEGKFTVQRRGADGAVFALQADGPLTRPLEDLQAGVRQALAASGGEVTP